MENPIKIEEIQRHQFSDFFVYLTEHLADNGKNDMFFQPASSTQVVIDYAFKENFRTGMDKPFGEKGWRKLWVARNEAGQIAGHIDIRSYGQLNTSHRVLLGMGVDLKHRKQKIGQRLLDFVIEYCSQDPRISWLDLEVLSLNLPARSLYQKMDFQEICTKTDMFRIDGKSFDYTSMSLNVDA